MHNKYTSEDFDEDLRSVLRRSGCKDEKIAFILDESNVLDSGFLERMNTLLANGEVPGLFEGKLIFRLISLHPKQIGANFDSSSIVTLPLQAMNTLP